MKTPVERLRASIRSPAHSPLLDRIVALIVEESGPLGDRHHDRLLTELFDLLYRPFRDFERLTADALNALAWRLAAVEAAIARPERPSVAVGSFESGEGWCHSGRPRMAHRWESPATERQPIDPGHEDEPDSLLIEAILDRAEIAYEPRGLTRRVSLRRRLVATLGQPFRPDAPIEKGPLESLSRRSAEVEENSNRTTNFPNRADFNRVSESSIDGVDRPTGHRTFSSR